MIAEHEVLFDLVRRYPDLCQVIALGDVPTKSGREPILQFTVCDHREVDPHAPVIGFFAGVHGIEAIGVKILLVFLEHLLAQAHWNTQVSELLKRIRIVGIPIVNPAGYVAGSRCNGNGVDLMRNAPVESGKSLPFVGGHRISPMLPYYRGVNGLEFENLKLIELVERELWSAPFSFSLDIHSGFGAEDFLWTPYAKEHGHPPYWEHYKRFSDKLDRTFRNHVYRFEPQSDEYTTSGDLWDYLFDMAREQYSEDQHVFLPMTLEVGSWVWLKKSPLKATELRNFFNPAHHHRERRVLRRHLPLFNLLLNLVADYRRVLGVGETRRSRAG